MSTVLLAGGTGLIGTRLSAMLKEQGHEVRHLSREENLQAPFPAYRWNLDRKEIDPRALEGVDYVINLAGAGIADKPWTEGRKRLIISSRVDSTAMLRDAILRANKRPKAYISGAAIGYYGNRGDAWMDENSGPGTGFLSESCVAWEEAIRSVEATGVRTVGLRIGIVLSTQGGALPKLTMSLPFRMAPYFGNGKQWYSWIHIEDLCRIFLYVMQEETLSGMFNAVAPHPVTNRELMETLVQVKGVKAWVNAVPALAMRAAMGEMADTVLHSTRARAEKIQKAGFAFSYPEIRTALENLLEPTV